jgi:hypothetical protein
VLGILHLNFKYYLQMRLILKIWNNQISCHNRSMGRWEFEKNTALPVETVFYKCVGKHCRRQTFYGGCRVGGLTHFCVIEPAVFSRIKKKIIHNWIYLELWIIPVSKVYARRLGSKCWYSRNGTTRTALFSVITQREVLIFYRRFGTTYRTQLQGSRMVSRNDDKKSLLAA